MLVLLIPHIVKPNIKLGFFGLSGRGWGGFPAADISKFIQRNVVKHCDYLHYYTFAIISIIILFFG
jgi:hypothetical protein